MKEIILKIIQIKKGNLKSRLDWIIKNQNVKDEEANKILGCFSLAIDAYPFTIFMFQNIGINQLKD
jgi:hypothetical protein